MKILIISNHSYMLYRFRKELIQALMKDHQVVLSMPFVGHENDFQDMGIRCINTAVDRRGINPVTDLKLLVRYEKLLKAEKPDMVITYSIKPNIYAGLCCSAAEIPFCANVQGLGTAFQKKGLAALVTMLYRLSLRGAKAVFFENQGNARELLDRKIIAPEQVVVLNGAGIDLQEYPYSPYPENDTFRFLYLGRIMKEKGIDELFEAAGRLRAELGCSFVLDLVGFFDDDYEEKVKRMVDSGIAVFHGFRTDPRPFYRDADCVVLPSYHEGMSNVLLEAAALGRPVITSDIHGCKETVDNGETGYLCHAKDADSLYLRMKEMVSLPRQDRERMGRKAHQKMQQEFEKTSVVQKTIRSLFGAASPDRVQEGVPLPDA